MAEFNSSLAQSDEPRKRLKTGPPKHRSSQACQACRSRKVRCDVLANGARCTNCALDCLECVVLASRRGKNKHTAHNAAVAQSTHSHLPQSRVVDLDSDPASTQTGRAMHEDDIASAGSNVEARVIPVSVDFDEDLDNDRNERRSAGDCRDRDEVAHARHEADDGFLTPGGVTLPSEQYHSPTGLATLPAFIAPLSTHLLLSEDMQYLTLKGAFLLPEPDLQREIIRGYLFSAQPFLPILDSREFTAAVLSSGEQGRVSLLLFQAVMFAGLHSLEPPTIHKLGFETTKQAREVFFNRARLLYDFDVEPNGIAVFQSLLLMSTWYSKWHDRRHTWHWTGLAYDVARSMGLHREPTTRQASDKICRFRKRLWWSLYIRDRMIALGTRRPMRIRDDDFDVAMLTLYDFDIPTLQERNDEMYLSLPSREEATSTALMCIQLAKLGICIGHVVSSQYTTLNAQPDAARTMLVVPRRDGAALDQLEACNNELSEWYRASKEDTQWPDLSTTSQELPSCSEVHWSILRLTHLTTVNVLHRAQALHPSPDLAEAQKQPETARMKVKDAARAMTKLIQTMLQKNQARFLGLIGVTATIAACLSHMLDINSSDEDVRDASTLRLYQSVQVLQYLRGIYASADAASSFVASLAGQAGISIPAQVVPFTAEFSHVGTSNLKSTSTAFNQSQRDEHLAVIPTSKWPLSHTASNSGQSKSAEDSRWSTQSQSRDAPRRSLVPGSAESATAAPPLPSSSGFGSRARDMFGNPTASEQGIFQVDTTFGEPWNPSTGPAAFEWNSNNVFSYDFFMDASDFPDGHNRGFQLY